MSAPVLIATLMRPQGETGVQTHCRALLDQRAAQGLSTRLVTPFDAPRWQVLPVFALRRLIDPLHGAASVWWYRHWHAHFLHRALRRGLADGAACTVYAQCPPSADAALRARRHAGQRVVMVVHFNLSQADEWAGKGRLRDGGRLHRRIRAFEADVLPRLDGLVFVSQFMRRTLVARIPALSQVAHRVLPNFVADPGAVPAGPGPQRDLLCIGTLEARKNQRHALDIVAAAAAQGRRLTLTLAGDGPDAAALRTHAQALGIAAQVHFAGFVPQAAALFSTHRAALHVARIENLPLTLVEALAQGRPVFAAGVGGVPEVFDDGVQGRLLNGNDAAEDAARILGWLDNPAVLAQASQAARQRFLDRFEAHRVGTELNRFLECPA